MVFRRDAERRESWRRGKRRRRGAWAETCAQLGRAVEAGPVDVKREIRRQVKAELAERLE